MKVCTECLVSKTPSEFHKRRQAKDGLRGYCKKCAGQYMEWYYVNNLKAHAIRNREYRESHKIEIAKYGKEYRTTNRKRLSSYYGVYASGRRKIDLSFKLTQALRHRLYLAIRGNFRSGSAVRNLGCSIPELKLHLERQFQDGMSWDNWSRNGWHIDHILPLDGFDLLDFEQLKKACHYTNLRPMWAEDNRKKGNKIIL